MGIAKQCKLIDKSIKKQYDVGLYRLSETITGAGTRPCRGQGRVALAGCRGEAHAKGEKKVIE